MLKQLSVVGTLCLAMVGLLGSGSAQAALVDRGGGMLYDTVLNVTWLQDANYAKTSGYDADGRMNWTQANTWANSLEYGGYSDWRLASGEEQSGERNAVGVELQLPARRNEGCRLQHYKYVLGTFLHVLREPWAEVGCKPQW